MPLVCGVHVVPFQNAMVPPEPTAQTWLASPPHPALVEAVVPVLELVHVPPTRCCTWPPELRASHTSVALDPQMPLICAVGPLVTGVHALPVQGNSAPLDPPVQTSSTPLPHPAYCDVWLPVAVAVHAPLFQCSAVPDPP